MLNHAIPSEADSEWRYSDDRGGFVMKAKKEITSGQTVTDSYGDKGNRDLFLNYGFNLRDNKDNEVAVRVLFDRKDPLLKDKIELVNLKWSEEKAQEEGGYHADFMVQNRMWGEKERDFVQFCRFVTFQGDVDLVEELKIAFFQK